METEEADDDTAAGSAAGRGGEGREDVGVGADDDADEMFCSLLLLFECAATAWGLEEGAWVRGRWTWLGKGVVRRERKGKQKGKRGRLELGVELTRLTFFFLNSQ